MIKMMFAAPRSGSGKTTVTTGMLALLKRKGLKTCAFKCGPDYIDPMFHRAVLGIDSHNMDLFFMDREAALAHYERYTRGADAVVFEGVMGFYDGAGVVTADASSWHVADTFDVPVILVIDAKGASLTLAALIKGLAEFRKPGHVAGVILNNCSEMLYKSIAEGLERESGVPILGCVPRMDDVYIESRYLGLYTAGEIEDINKRIERIADQLEKSVDLERLL
ncbi:MAG: AAA family ATPase, partial [Lachnospiraceae bacterium]|nr:AAA family ATPase [Lachnospiraceae bacterium]